MKDRKKEIIETLKKEGPEGLKKIKVTNKEIDELVDNIDEKLAKLNMEQTLEISKKLGYNLPSDYCIYYSKLLSLHIKSNLFKVNGKEKVIRYLYSMDMNSKTYIMKFQNIDSQYKERLVPFAELEFGDILCFEKNTDEIIYYNHEEDNIEKIANNWGDFMKMLYENEV